MSVRDAAKSAAYWTATAAILPALASYRVRALIIGRDRALEGSSQALAIVPGMIGQYLRRAFLSRVLASCDRSVTVEFGTIFSRADTRLDAAVYIGPRCHIGLVHIEQGVLVAAGVHIPSGAMTHGTDDTTVPIRDQAGVTRMVRIGAGSWIGSAAVVMADVGCDTIVGAGSVVTRPLPECVMAAGVPAKVIRQRAERRSA